MSENTDIGPLDDNDSDDLSVTSHETLGHLDDTPGGSDENKTISLPSGGGLIMDQYPY